jgi:tetratricopeptide (TPR) repeat protein
MVLSAAVPTNPVDVHARTEAESPSAKRATYETGPGAGDGDGPPLSDTERYVLGDELARGGMGRIVRATDRRLGREVAIKVLLGESPQLAARFARESEVIARLQHPSIVPIHDRGRTDDGRPFYTMKLVEGRTLDDAIRAAGDAAARTALVPHVVAVVDAIAYAHSQRIIHRDLKPLNVLVGSFGETLVIDWGLAKELGTGDDGGEAMPSADGPLLTRHGQVVGTPAYMPPEQAAGRPVDERADVYSLGAMLYHVLSGEPPFAGSDDDRAAENAPRPQGRDVLTAREPLRDERRILVDVVERTPKPLDQLRKDLPDDLVAIVDRAMARDPAQRYPSAQEMAADLRRHQAGQLVSAHRYTLGQRIARLVRRHPAVVTITISLLAVIVLAVYAFLEIQRERDIAVAANRRAETQREAAEGIAQHMLTDLRSKLEPIGKLALLDTVGKRVDDYYRAIDPGQLGDGSLARRARTVEMRADVARASGDGNAARELYEEAAQLASDAGAPVVTAHIWISLADVLLDQGKVDEAEGVLHKAHDLVGAESAKVAANVGLRLGMIAATRGDNAAALAAWKKAADDFEELVKTDPTQLNALHNVAVAHGMAADMYWQMNEVDTARAELAIARSALDRLITLEPENPEWMRNVTLVTDRLGEMALWDEKLDEAERSYRDSLAIAEKLAAHDPDNAHWQSDLAFSLRNVAYTHLHQHRYAEALALVDRALVIQRKVVAGDPNNKERVEALAELHQMRADALRWLDPERWPEALEEAMRSRGLRGEEVARSPDDPSARFHYAESCLMIGELLSAKRPDDAVASLEEGLAILTKLAATDDSISEWRRIAAETELALARTLHRRPATRAKAREHAQRAQAALERLRDADEIRKTRYGLIDEAKLLAK